MRDVISRACYKKVKRKDRIVMNAWLSDYALIIYNDALLDAAASEILALRDEFGMTTEEIARFMKKRDNTIQSINQRLISAEQLFVGLIDEEGLSIKTDFLPRDLAEVPDIDESEAKLKAGEVKE